MTTVAFTLSSCIRGYHVYMVFTQRLVITRENSQKVRIRDPRDYNLECGVSENIIAKIVLAYCISKIQRRENFCVYGIISNNTSQTRQKCYRILHVYICLAACACLSYIRVTGWWIIRSSIRTQLGIPNRFELHSNQLATCSFTFYCDPYFLFQIFAYILFLAMFSSYNPLRCVFGLW